MSELKTRKNDASVAAFLNGITDERQRQDSKVIAKMMREITGNAPQMWGTEATGSTVDER